MKTWFLGGGLLVVITASCASKSPDQQYASEFAQAICDSLEPCCQANGFTFDRGNCEIGGAGYVQSGNDAAKKAGATFDQKAADDCVAAVRQLAMSCKSGADDPVLAAPCTHVWVGSKAAGEACSSDVECAPGSGRGACVMGSCVVLTTGAKIGDACAVATAPPPPALADCGAAGLQCDALNSKTCIAKTAMGAPCGGLTTCMDGAFCDTTAGTCVATLALGATCTANNQCTSKGCINGKCAANDLGTSKPCNGT